ncbi:MAG TPA: hypothetical protein DCS07_12600 [Bdellovibrionales bacterium]|nr:MAG: hypothetical protein A2Z97_08405 [Bdellovibrionales bacterium GWB1_52_6]OFZ33609.1 MAG: hypothetical protein A2070_11540 [Bdellovibrionales bacterium GWC1_52_8]HAR43450.1 hypothetical protein [Bdellovibrionales bacterium]HCM39458.1 hypothetical protein [Bdellovibrionales bacterium]
MEEMRQEIEERDRRPGGLRLMPRDFDILTFLFEQKFASLPMLYYRFFDRRPTVEEAPPANHWVTRQRLMVLKQAGLIASERVYTDSKAVYLLTDLGYDLLKTNRELTLDKGPLTTIDFRTYQHDKRVSLCRVALERQGKCLRWHSDRYLQHKKGYPLLSGKFYRLFKGLIPDGIFVSSREELVALEVEHTHKRRERYAEKRFQYKAVIEQSERQVRQGEDEALFPSGDLRRFNGSSGQRPSRVLRPLRGVSGPEL